MATFSGTPNMLVNLKNPIGRIKRVRFDHLGLFSTENPKLIKRFSARFEVATDVKTYPCKECVFIGHRKADITNHYKVLHPKGAKNEQLTKLSSTSDVS